MGTTSPTSPSARSGSSWSSSTGTGSRNRRRFFRRRSSAGAGRGGAGTAPAGQSGHIVRGVDVEPGGEEGVGDPRGPASQGDPGQDRSLPPIHAPEQGRSVRREREGGE